MPATTNEGVLSGIQDRILDDLQTRIQNESHIPGFVLDSVARMHPVDVSKAVEGELRLLSSADETSVETMPPERAWWSVNHLTYVTAVPYIKPIDLLHSPRIQPELAKAISPFDAISFLVGQRLGLERTAVHTGPLISEELVKDEAASVSVEAAVKGMLYYHSRTSPNQTLFHFPVINMTKVKSHDLIVEDPDFSPEIIISIPVANGQERDTLPQTLRLLAEQSLDHEMYEIVLLHNTKLSKQMYEQLVSDDPYETGDALSREIADEQEWLYEVYQDLLKDYPWLRIRADFAVNDPYTTIGGCRQQLGDNIARTYVARGSTNNPLLLSMDADIRSLNKDYLQNMLLTAEQTGAPVIASRIKWRADKDATVGPYTSKLLRLGLFMHSAACASQNLPNFTDSGTAILLKDYCLAGGHNWTDSFAENIRIAQLLHMNRVRHDNPVPTVQISRGSIFGSDPRRQIDVLARGYPPSLAWKQGITTFGKNDDKVRVQATPYEEAEAMASAELSHLIKDMVVHAFGTYDSEAYLKKVEVLRKGLDIIGLPDYLPEPVELATEPIL